MADDEDRLGNRLDDAIEGVLDTVTTTDEITAAVAEAVLDEVSMHLQERLPTNASEITCLEDPPPWRWTNSGRPKCSARTSELVHPACYKAEVMRLVT